MRSGQEQPSSTSTTSTSTATTTGAEVASSTRARSMTEPGERPQVSVETFQAPQQTELQRISSVVKTMVLSMKSNEATGLQDLKQLVNQPHFALSDVTEALGEIKVHLQTFALKWGGAFGSSASPQVLNDLGTVSAILAIIKHMAALAQGFDNLAVKEGALAQQFAQLRHDHSQIIGTLTASHAQALTELKTAHDTALRAAEERNTQELAALREQLETKSKKTKVSKEQVAAAQAEVSSLKDKMWSETIAELQATRTVVAKSVEENAALRQETSAMRESLMLNTEQAEKLFKGVRESLSRGSSVHFAASEDEDEEEAPSYEAIHDKLQDYVGVTKIKLLAHLQLFYEASKIVPNKTAIFELMSRLLTRPEVAIVDLSQEVPNLPVGVKIDDTSLGALIKKYGESEASNEDLEVLQVLSASLVEANRVKDSKQPEVYRNRKLREAVKKGDVTGNPELDQALGYAMTPSASSSVTPGMTVTAVTSV